MSELAKLIDRLQLGIDKKSVFVKTIKHPRLLLSSLKELLEVIGNDEVKKSVATQISHLIVSKRRAEENPDLKTRAIMLNIIMTANPGSGKSVICTILAKIYYALGYLKGAQNPPATKKGLGDMLKGAVESNTGSTTDDGALAFYTILIILIIVATFISLMWSCYEKFGGMWTVALLILLILMIIIFAAFALANTDNSPQQNVGNAETPAQKDEDSNNIIKTVSRADFVDKYVGWTAQKTLKLLNENLGKVLFVDEAYSLLNGPHDEFGMEALTTLNLFMSEHPNEIIVIFAGYKDLIEAGPFSVQPGLKSRFMWQFECTPYNAEQLFEIFKLQIKKDGRTLSDEKETLKLFHKYQDVFIGYGRDTDRCAEFASIELSNDALDDDELSLNKLTPSHVERGILTLKQNNFSSTTSESSNPLANMMKMMSEKKFEDNLYKQATNMARH